MHFNGVGAALDYTRAFERYSRAAELCPPGGEVRRMALHNMASMYYDGLGVAKDTVVARRILEVAAEESGGGGGEAG